MTDIQADCRFACDDVRRTRQCFHGPHSRYKPLHGECHFFYFGNPGGRARERILPQVHRCRTGMVCVPSKPEGSTSLPCNGSNQAERKTCCIKNRPLLNVELQESCSSAWFVRSGVPRFAAEPPNSIGDGNADLIFQVK